MLELYHNNMSVCAQKVRLVLIEKNLDWIDHHLDIFAGETRTAEYKILNPNGVVPTLITEKRNIIIESTVIAEFLDDEFPSPPLRPNKSYLIALMRLWTKQLDEGIHLSTASISNAIAFRYAHVKDKTKEEVKKYFRAIPDPVRRERLWDLTQNGTNSEYFVKAIIRFEKLFADMELILSENRWLAGNEYSLADIGFTPYLTRFDHLNLLGILDNRPSLLKWYENVRKRRSFELAIDNWLDDDIVSLMFEKGSEVLPDVKKLIDNAR